jgi:predicted NBD/HSP70 family sugar kinase
MTNNSRFSRYVKLSGKIEKVSLRLKGTQVVKKLQGGIDYGSLIPLSGRILLRSFLNWKHVVRRIDLEKVSVARSNTVRDINRQIVLNFVREKGPISRAEIARATNLQRSTVSLIVSELKTSALIREVYGESSGGRPPALLTLRTSRPIGIGVDLGTAKTTVATCDLTGRVIKKEEFLTDPDAEKTTDLIIESINRLALPNGNAIEGIGISLPALVDTEKGHIIYAPYFDWSSPKMIEKIESETGIQVIADNDANAAALAELWFGRPEVRDTRDFILVFVENGIGAGIVFDGQIYRGKNGVAGEFGHMRIGAGAPIECGAGGDECWEAFASERAALARYAKLHENADQTKGITFTQLLKRALTGEQKALTSVKETAHFIGIGLANLIQGLSPEVIIVGGSIVKAWGVALPEIRAGVETGLCKGIPATNIVPSSLGPDPALKGAFSLVLSKTFARVSL